MDAMVKKERDKNKDKQKGQKANERLKKMNNHSNRKSVEKREKMSHKETDKERENKDVRKEKKRKRNDDEDQKGEKKSEKRKVKDEQDGPNKKVKRSSKDTPEKPKNERYNPNRFVRNSDSDELQDKSYRYFVRPYLPFWSSQKLTFEEINKSMEIPSSRTTSSSCPKRYVLHHLVKTWLIDEPWFDKKEIFDLIQDDLRLKLESASYGYKKEITRTCSQSYCY